MTNKEALDLIEKDLAIIDSKLEFLRLRNMIEIQLVAGFNYVDLCFSYNTRIVEYENGLTIKPNEFVLNVSIVCKFSKEFDLTIKDMTEKELFKLTKMFVEKAKAIVANETKCYEKTKALFDNIGKDIQNKALNLK